MPVPLICPVCQAPLTWGEKTVICPGRHSFDIAREGYVNLYRTSKPPVNQPGDTVDMLRARRAFLDTGWYASLSDRLNDLAVRYVNAGRRRTRECCILDAGCGEGYYLGRLLKHLQEIDTERQWCGCGIDISKPAIRLAARRYRAAQWCVANTAHHIPCADGSIDIACCLFAPRFSDVLRRVMTPDGLLCVVIPGEDHLLELNAVAMAGVRDTGDKEAVIAEQFSTHFHLWQRQHLTYQMPLDHAALWDLYRMTPICWRSTGQARERVEKIKAMTVTASFVILVFTPRSNTGY